MIPESKFPMWAELRRHRRTSRKTVRKPDPQTPLHSGSTCDWLNRHMHPTHSLRSEEEDNISKDDRTVRRWLLSYLCLSTLASTSYTLFSEVLPRLLIARHLVLGTQNGQSLRPSRNPSRGVQQLYLLSWPNISSGTCI